MLDRDLVTWNKFANDVKYRRRPGDVNLVTFGSGYGLLPARRQAIIRTSDGSVLVS